MLDYDKVQPIPSSAGPGKAASMGRNFYGIPWESWLQEKEQAEGKKLEGGR